MRVARPRAREVVDVAGRDERQPVASAASFDELRVDPRCCTLEACVLELDVGASRAEDLRQPVEIGVRASAGRFSSSALQTRPERQPESAISPFE